MGLRDALQAQRDAKVKGPSCIVCALVEQLPDEESTALSEALDDLTLSGEAISRALEAEGYRIQGQTIQRHRRRKCYGAA